MKQTPPGWPRASSALCYERAQEAIDWLTKAFGFEVRLKVPGEGGKIEHAELVFGEAIFMVSDPRPERPPHRRAPSELGGANTQNIMIYVDDVEAHRARALAAGAKAEDLATHDYGEEHFTDRGYACTDLGGHHWWFAERLRTGAGRAENSTA
jgi:uncharacterized glyoxalase superfamily protein PhnB